MMHLKYNSFFKNLSSLHSDVLTLNRLMGKPHQPAANGVLRVSEVRSRPCRWSVNGVEQGGRRRCLCSDTADGTTFGALGPSSGTFHRESGPATHARPKGPRGRVPPVRLRVVGQRSYGRPSSCSLNPRHHLNSVPPVYNHIFISCLPPSPAMQSGRASSRSNEQDLFSVSFLLHPSGVTSVT